MAKFLTLNTHSWLEANALKKLFDLAETIYSEDYDVICLQEINQDIRGLETKEVEGYEKLPGSPALHRDNYALQLVNYLKSQGRYYYWSWAYNHIGYDKYNEGVVILSKKPIKVQDILVSEVDDEHDFHTRRVLAAETEVDGKPITVVSLHMSWYGKGFESEWAKLEKALSDYPKPLVLMGDFNNPTDTVGYEMILKSPLDLQDSHKVAKVIKGDHTIIEDIDGWEGNKQSLKVDHVFTSKDIDIQSSKVVFDGGESPIVSDHFGLAVELNY
ncbi:maltose 6'-phosphate phosphatase [Streptococcus equinus]|uniref:Maltose 6'-phosphate phosphatase n=1 Tax=Streptococcus equinus TaxID=1335 RepID=A0A239RC70_STREI|nr:endonuclease/exonuclease/phosphatase family protein [Streptococcus equinus]SNU08399.1 maltose 6'-phosphate phosphatase [Streptococcus equinus]